MDQREPIYLDHHTTTRPCSRSIEQLNWLLKEAWGSFRSPHQKGQEAVPKIQHEISFLYEWLGAETEDLLLFDSLTTSIDALNEMIFFQLAKGKGKNHLVLPEIEERPTWSHWQKQGCIIKHAPVTEKGIIDLKALDEILGPRCAILSLFWAHPFTGVMQPVEEIAKICKAKNVLLHVDASLVLGKIPLSFHELAIDFLSFSGTYIHAPAWTKALWVKRKHAALFTSERYFDPATALSLIEACRQMMLTADQTAMEFARLRMQFMKKLNQMGAYQLFSKTPGLNNHCIFAFDGVSSEALAYALNERRVYVSYDPKQADILSRCQISDRWAHSALAFSLSRYNTEEGVQRAAQILAEEYEKLKSHSRKL